MVHNIGPSLEGDALEDSEHGQAEVVKVGDAEVRSVPAFPADHFLAESGTVEAGLVIAWMGHLHDLTWNDEIGD